MYFFQLVDTKVRACLLRIIIYMALYQLMKAVYCVHGIVYQYMCDIGASFLCVHKSLTVILQSLASPSFWNNRFSDERVPFDKNIPYIINKDLQ
jgi:hypothetical protein